MLIVTALLGKSLLSLKPVCSFLSVLSLALLNSVYPWSGFSSQSPQVFCLVLQPDVALGEAYAGRMRGHLSVRGFENCGSMMGNETAATGRGNVF